MIVKKKDGREEPFQRSKMERAIRGAGATEEVARQIAAEVESRFAGRPSVTSTELRTEVLAKLKVRDAKAHANWLKYKKKM